jgi:hypothetical protein
MAVHTLRYIVTRLRMLLRAWGRPVNEAEIAEAQVIAGEQGAKIKISSSGADTAEPQASGSSDDERRSPR